MQTSNSARQTNPPSAATTELHGPVVTAIGLRPDPELGGVLEIAARVGVASGDEVLVSYSSLFLALLESDDQTSRWLQEEMARRNLPAAPVLRHRNIQPARLEGILADSEVLSLASARKFDPVSISARTVLNEAREIARESGQSPDQLLGVRHVLAAYLFRNPPGHDLHLIREWGFDLEAWRRAFARFLETTYSSEFSSWSSVLSGYRTEEKTDDDTVPGQVLADLVADDDTVRVLRTLEAAAMRAGQPVLDSERLFNTFGTLSEDFEECKALRETIGPSWSPTAGPALVTEVNPLTDGGSSLPLTSELKEILDRSRILASETTLGPEVAVRHLIAALILGPTSKGHASLLQTGVQLPRLRRRMFDAFVKRWVNDDGGRWRFHLIGSRPPTVAEYTADDAEMGSDELDVARYARAFAAVMASKAVRPPLSIGIFGDWGSGKSFFMRLMREETSRVLQTPEMRELFHQQIVPVRFNAWHYAEANLWASLVQEILQQLHKKMAETKEGSELIDSMIDALELAKEARKAAEAKLVIAGEELAKRQGELAEKEKEAQEQAETLGEMEDDRKFLQAVAATFLDDTRLNGVLAFAEKYLHLPGLVARKNDIVKDARELRATLARVRAVAARSRTSLGWIGAVSFPLKKLLLLALGVFVLGLGLVLLFREKVGEAWAVASSVLVWFSAVSAGLFHWIRQSLTQVEQGLDEVESLQHEVDDRLKSAENAHAEAVAAQRARVEAADAEVAAAQAALKAADDAVKRAAALVEESTSIRRISRLIQQRIDSQDYSKHLGIISMIRKDFETISALMTTLASPGEQRALAAVEGEVAVGARLRPIERIVLYIDDLDRCPSEKVVVVLEAIHLLLAIDLFVVVVGVDIRWAAQSLLERYPQHLRPVSFEKVTTDVPPGEGASALDYLEKIFQIPFWLPPMEESASRELIRALVPVTGKAASGEGNGAPATARSKSPQAERGATSNVGDTAQTARPKGELDAGSLRIEASERDFMLGLAGAVGKSPRRLKRFVNTYRILKASLDGLEAEDFVVDGGKAGQYRAAMCLLAMLTGAPRLSIKVLRELQQLRDDTELKALEDTLEVLGDDPEVGYLRAGLNAYRGAFQPAAEPKVDELRYWAPQVARFSFRSGRG